MFKKIFITGLAAVIPLVVTLSVIVWFFNFVDGFLGKFINKILAHYVGYTITGLGFILSILIVLALGVLIHFSRQRFYKWTERTLAQIPIVNKIYFPVKKMVDFLFFPPKKSFKSAVLVEYPRKGIYSLGFITNESCAHFKEKIGGELYNVFIPSTPSPFTGMTIILRKEEIVFLDMNIDEVIKLIVSGGLLNPYD